jgi:hypothetical protein
MTKVVVPNYALLQAIASFSLPARYTDIKTKIYQILSIFRCIRVVYNYVGQQLLHIHTIITQSHFTQYTFALDAMGKA